MFQSPPKRVSEQSLPKITKISNPIIICYVSSTPDTPQKPSCLILWALRSHPKALQNGAREQLRKRCANDSKKCCKRVYNTPPKSTKNRPSKIHSGASRVPLAAPLVSQEGPGGETDLKITLKSTRNDTEFDQNLIPADSS